MRDGWHEVVAERKKRGSLGLVDSASAPEICGP